ncbi:glycoside hydrolase family 38 C-terminal domain-containing protein [Rosettibacter firmus]|uniref:glycoside hydrolase family 38 N-terminal domain-containing protein n=1 Tax=Rosettibacter firmus TaxID=3111522 RepID=UPI00336BFD56
MFIRIIILLIITIHLSYGQNFINGFSKAISGPEIEYHSPHPYATKALISRATDGNMIISWMTDEIQNSKSDKITFIWLSGLGCNLGEQPFTLYLNDDSLLTFFSWDKELWTVTGKYKSQLSFRSLMVDKSNDRFGIMQLCVDSDVIKNNKQIKLSIKGHKRESRAWVMVYEYQIKNELIVKPFPALVKINNELKQPVKLTFVYLGDKTNVSIVSSEVKIDTSATYGFNQFDILLPEIKETRSEQFKIYFDNKILESSFIRNPVKKLEIFLVQHSHTDIGYTRPQHEILAEHLRYIDLALDYCDLTDSYPEEAKFHWTCEVAFPVQEYLNSRPNDRIEKLKKRFKEGRIELTALPFNLSEILDENMLVASLEPLKNIVAAGFPIRTAMQDDVNGVSWTYVDYLSDIGIKYLSMGVNTARALKPFKYPTPFYWESRSGKKLLAFRADHYMSANFVSNSAGDIQYVEDELFKYIEQLLQSGYPFNEIEMQFSGYHTDNSPPSMMSSDIVKLWNEKYAWPKLRLSTISQFLNVIEKKYSHHLKVYRLAWLDWWTDGFASAPRETAIAIKTQKQLLATQGLLSIAKLYNLKIPDNLFDEIREIQEQLLFYGEHTFGAAESISDPFTKNSLEQWLTKSSFAWQANWRTYLLKQKSLSLFLPLIKKSENCKVVVFNTSNHTRSTEVEVFIDKQFLPLSKSFLFTDDNGKQLNAEIIKQIAEGSYVKIWVDNIPPYSWKTFNLLLKESLLKNNLLPKTNILENDYYYIEIDDKTGEIKHIIDKEYNLELVDKNNSWGFGTFLKEFLSDRQNLELYRLGEFKRETLKKINIESINNNSIWKSITLSGFTSDSEKVSIDIRLYNTTKKIDMVYTINKTRILKPESIYIAFPFKLDGGNIYFNLQGNFLKASTDQLEGTSNDWNTVQNYVTVRNNQYQIILSSPDCPLMQFGNINTGRFNPLAKPETTHIYAWPYNNYWGTNFKAWEEGELSWQFSFTSTKDTSINYAELFGENIQLPLIGFVIPPSKSDSKINDILQTNSKNKIDFIGNISNVTVPHILPLREENALFILIREIDGKNVNIKIPDSYKIYLSNVTGHLKKRIYNLKLNPHESKFLIIKK